MTDGLMVPEVLRALRPELVSPAMLVLAHESAPNRTILCAGAGSFEASNITMTRGVHINTDCVPLDKMDSRLAQQLAEVLNRQGDIEVRRPSGWDVIGGLLGEFDERIRRETGLDWA